MSLSTLWSGCNYKNNQGRKYKNTNLMCIHLASYYAFSILNRTQQITVAPQIYDEWTKNTLNITVQGPYLLSALDFWAVFCKTTSVLPIERWKEERAPAMVNIHTSLLTLEINVFNPAMGLRVSACREAGKGSLGQGSPGNGASSSLCGLEINYGSSGSICAISRPISAGHCRSPAGTL